MQSDFKDWFDRTVGEWRSERRYLYYGPNGPTAQMITTYFDTTNPEPDLYVVKWESYPHDKEGNRKGNAMTGSMALRLEGAKLKRDRGYFTADETHQYLERVDADTVVFTTAYGGHRYREEIRMLGDDLRLRQTVAHREDDDSLYLAGQYVETRI